MYMISRKYACAMLIVIGNIAKARGVNASDKGHSIENLNLKLSLKL